MNNFECHSPLWKEKTIIIPSKKKLALYENTLNHSPERYFQYSGLPLCLYLFDQTFSKPYYMWQRDICWLSWFMMWCYAFDSFSCSLPSEEGMSVGTDMYSILSFCAQKCGTSNFFGCQTFPCFSLMSYEQKKIILTDPPGVWNKMIYVHI